MRLFFSAMVKIYVSDAAEVDTMFPKPKVQIIADDGLPRTCGGKAEKHISLDGKSPLHPPRPQTCPLYTSFIQYSFWRIRNYSR
jgi:hypothetical protein